MGFGVLESKKLEHVPGTALLDDHGSQFENVLSIFKRGTGKDSHIILVPQPSNDPNDPLNWPRWKKLTCFWMLCFATGTALCTVGLVSSSALLIMEHFNIGYTQFSQLIGFWVLMAGPSVWIAAASIPFIGKRPIYMISMTLLLISSIWAASSKSYNSLLAARCFQGIAAGPVEAVVSGTISDLFFLHERGFYSTLWVLSQLLPSQITPIAGAYIAANPKLGWRWMFWFLVPPSAISFIGVFFLCPETYYVRSAKYELDLGTKDHVQEIIAGAKDESAVAAHLEMVESHSAEIPKHSYIHQLRLWPEKILAPDNFWRVLFRPVTLLLIPSIAWSTLVYSMSVSWVIVMNVTLAQVLSPPPYNFDTDALGLVFFSPMVCQLLACIVCGPTLDWVAKFCARRNGGVYEPEFRILGLIPFFAFGVMAFFGFGLSVAAVDNWFGPVFFFGIIGAAVIFGSTTIISYVIDAHRPIAAEGLITINLMKAFVAYGFSLFTNSWITSQGPLKTFCTIGGLHSAICLTGVIAYVYGKRWRAMVASVPFLRRLEEYAKPGQNQ